MVNAQITVGGHVLRAETGNYFYLFMSRDALTRLVNYTFLVYTKMAISTLRNVYANFEEKKIFNDF